MHEIFKEVAAIYLNDGIEKIKIKDWQGALIDLDKVLNLDNSLLEAIFYKGYATRELHLYNESIEYFKMVLSIDPNHLAALLQMSYSLCSLKRYEEALTIINKAVSIEPDDWWCYIKRAGIKEALGDLDGAKMDEDIAGKMDHDFPF